MFRVLLVEDEPILGELIKETLEDISYQVDWVLDGKDVAKIFKLRTPDICILDVMLPSIDGFDVARIIRSIQDSTPILFLTARSKTEDVLKGFASGGNDYLKKPFSIDELKVRVNELLKRYHVSFAPGNDKKEIYAIGDYTFSPLSQVLKRGNVTHYLPYKEAAVLTELIININRVTNRSHLLEKLWGSDNAFNARNLDVHIVKLRKYFKDNSRISILNVKGFGYKLVDNTC